MSEHLSARATAERLRAPCTVRIESTDWLSSFTEGIAEIDDLAWGHRHGRPGQTEHELTIDNRGLVARLRRNQRLVAGEAIWYGYFTREVTLRVWHDGSISVESEIDR